MHLISIPLFLVLSFLFSFFRVRLLTRLFSPHWNQDSGFPCFKGGPRTIQNLRKRFHLSLTEEVLINILVVRDWISH